MAFTSDGQVMVWGDLPHFGFPFPPSQSQTLIPAGQTGKVVVDIGSGDNFSLALTSDGQLYTWGRNSSISNVPAGLAVITGWTAAKVRSSS